jgi:mazG domain protein
MNMTRRNFEPPRAVLCGSYKRDREGLFRAYDELVVTGCQVLSPQRMQFDDEAFVRDTAEQGISSRAIEDRHLLAICKADLVMVHAPDGYVGLSAAMEIGFATAQKCPVFSRTAPQDIALRGLVKVVPSVYDVLCVVGLR